MFAARLMPLTNPRQALATSKLMAELGSPRPWWRRTATDGSRCLRVTEVLMRRPTSEGSTPASASARRPAETVASSDDSSEAQLRRSITPATRSRRLPGSLRRRSADERRSSMSSDVVTRLGRVLATDNSETLSKRVVAFPATGPPLNGPVRLDSSRAPLYAVYMRDETECTEGYDSALCYSVLLSTGT